MQCDAALGYKKAVNSRIDKDIKTLANLTGWDRDDIRRKIEESGKGQPFDLNPEPKKNDWWNRIWPE